MSEKKHTPGPWEVARYENGSAHKGFSWCYIRQATPFNKHGGKLTVVGCDTVSIWTGEDSYDESGVVMKEADACLIAAAPDMLEALEEAADYIEATAVGGRYVDIKDHVGKARAITGKINNAIRKAKGEDTP